MNPFAFSEYRKEIESTSAAEIHRLAELDREIRTRFDASTGPALEAARLIERKTADFFEAVQKELAGRYGPFQILEFFGKPMPTQMNTMQSVQIFLHEIVFNTRPEVLEVVQSIALERGVALQAIEGRTTVSEKFEHYKAALQRAHDVDDLRNVWQNVSEHQALLSADEQEILFAILKQRKHALDVQAKQQFEDSIGTEDAAKLTTAEARLYRAMQALAAGETAGVLDYATVETAKNRVTRARMALQEGAVTEGEPVTIEEIQEAIRLAETQPVEELQAFEPEYDGYEEDEDEWGYDDEEEWRGPAY